MDCTGGTKEPDCATFGIVACFRGHSENGPPWLFRLLGTFGVGAAGGGPVGGGTGGGARAIPPDIAAGSAGITPFCIVLKDIVPLSAVGGILVLCELPRNGAGKLAKLPRGCEGLGPGGAVVETGRLFETAEVSVDFWGEAKNGAAESGNLPLAFGGVRLLLVNGGSSWPFAPTLEGGIAPFDNPLEGGRDACGMFGKGGNLLVGGRPAVIEVGGPPGMVEVMADFWA